jgi:hypothetical protein
MRMLVKRVIDQKPDCTVDWSLNALRCRWFSVRPAAIRAFAKAPPPNNFHGVGERVSIAFLKRINTAIMLSSPNDAASSLPRLSVTSIRTSFAEFS